MGQMWTDEMQARLERSQAYESVSDTLQAGPIDSTDLRLCDVLRGTLAYVFGIVRRRVTRTSLLSWSLAHQIDYARFERKLMEASSPEVEEWLATDLDIFQA